MRAPAKACVALRRSPVESRPVLSGGPMSNATRAEHEPGSRAGTDDKRPGATSIHAASREYRFWQFRVDVALCQLWRDHEVIPLTPKAFDTLVVLLQRRDQLVSKEKLMNAVWPDSFVSEDTL